MEHLTDCHTHTWYSGDGRCSVGELCATAHAKGLAAVAITDHFDYLMDGSGEPQWDLRAKLRNQELRGPSSNGPDGWRSCGALKSASPIGIPRAAAL